MNRLQTKQTRPQNNNVQIPQSNTNTQIVNTCLNCAGKIALVTIIGFFCIACYQISPNDFGRKTVEVVEAVEEATNNLTMPV